MRSPCISSLHTLIATNGFTNLDKYLTTAMCCSLRAGLQIWAGDLWICLKHTRRGLESIPLKWKFKAGWVKKKHKGCLNMMKSFHFRGVKVVKSLTTGWKTSTYAHWWKLDHETGAEHLLMTNKQSILVILFVLNNLIICQGFKRTNKTFSLPTGQIGQLGQRPQRCYL